ncbi:hypothetical protein BDY24DRAFT_381373 [Mrakia frigida]|uniref:uncharacterized protein n=1 Tax=Mrakia frigida TaxID=29902 RepID=UPI003FCC185D
MGFVRNLKVKPKKLETPMTCGSNFSAMLSCWAASGDLRNDQVCKESALALIECLKTTTRAKAPPKSTINAHLNNLTRLKRGKNLPGSPYQ